MPQRVSVKSRTTGKGHIVAFDPATCDWLAIVLLEGERRRIFVVPRDIADANAFNRSKAPKSASRGADCGRYPRPGPAISDAARAVVDCTGGMEAMLPAEWRWLD